MVHGMEQAASGLEKRGVFQGGKGIITDGNIIGGIVGERPQRK